MASTKSIIDYFKTACKNNLKLMHEKNDRVSFFRFNLSEIIENLRTGISYPAFGLENIEGNFEDLKADSVKNIVPISFVIIKPCDLLDFDEQEDVMDDCYKIGMEILSKMHKDAHNRDTIISKISVENGRYIPVGPIFSNHFGYRFTLDIKIENMSEIYFNPADWDTDLETTTYPA